MDLVQGKPTSIRLKQDIGEKLSKVKKLAEANSRYEIETPVAMANVRGSSMLVKVTTDGTTVENLAGHISVTAQGVEVTIPEGEISTIKPDQPPSVSVPSTMSVQTESTLSSCYFPVWTKFPTVGSFDSLSGMLIMENQLLGVKNPDDEFIIIVWPYGYSVYQHGNRIQVLDEKGQPQARLGDHLTIYGFVYGLKETEQNVSQFARAYGISLPSGFRGALWIAAPDSEFIYLPTQLVEFRDQPYPTATISGNLKIEEDQSVRLIAQDGKSYLPIFPNAYFISMEGEVMRRYPRA